MEEKKTNDLLPSTFGIMSAMKGWPPNPGSTVITRIISALDANGITDSIAIP
jgi:hypothetical protein